MSEHDGHRQRIIEKLDKGGLQEHELLEILLFNAIPRRNTNDIAHRLLAAFGGIEGVFSASVEQLKTVDGVGDNVAAYLRCIGIFYRTYRPKGERTYPLQFESATFTAYVREKYASEQTEVLDFYLLNGKREIFYVKRFTTNNLHSVRVSPEELTQLIVEHKSHNLQGMVIVHNHLCKSCFPSPADDDMTNQCQVICSIHSVLLFDHFIYSPVGIYSYYGSGKMKEINRIYSIKALLESQGERTE